MEILQSSEFVAKIYSIYSNINPGGGGGGGGAMQFIAAKMTVLSRPNLGQK